MRMKSKGEGRSAEGGREGRVRGRGEGREERGGGGLLQRVELKEFHPGMGSPLPGSQGVSAPSHHRKNEADRLDFSGLAKHASSFFLRFFISPSGFCGGVDGRGKL